MAKSFQGQSNIHLDIFIATSRDLGIPLNPVDVTIGGMLRVLSDHVFGCGVVPFLLGADFLFRS